MVRKIENFLEKQRCRRSKQFVEPFTNFEEIRKEWGYIENQEIQKIEFKILAIEKNTMIVEWLFERDVKVFDGIYEIKFDDNLQCVWFRSWEMEKK